MMKHYNIDEEVRCKMVTYTHPSGREKASDRELQFLITIQACCSSLLSIPMFVVDYISGGNLNRNIYMNECM